MPGEKKGGCKEKITVQSSAEQEARKRERKRERNVEEEQPMQPGLLDVIKQG